MLSSAPPPLQASSEPHCVYGIHIVCWWLCLGCSISFRGHSGLDLWLPLCLIRLSRSQESSPHSPRCPSSERNCTRFFTVSWKTSPTSWMATVCQSLFLASRWVTCAGWVCITHTCIGAGKEPKDPRDLYWGKNWESLSFLSRTCSQGTPQFHCRHRSTFLSDYKPV